jgi:hypothetical protein
MCKGYVFQEDSWSWDDELFVTNYEYALCNTPEERMCRLNHDASFQSRINQIHKMELLSTNRFY